jgi:tRNA(fMet)-specific endonuclease VapC
MFLLDTDYAVLMQRGTGTELQRLLARMAAHSASDFHYPIVSFHEQMLGANAYIGAVA